MCSSPSTPEMPAAPQRRAAERLPSRGTVQGAARRRVEATQGRNMQSTILGRTGTGAQRTAQGGARRGTSAGGEVKTELGG